MIAKHLFVPSAAAIALTNLTIFLNSILSSSQFNVLVLICENKTLQETDIILRSDLVRYRETYIINVDLKLPVNKNLNESRTMNKYFVISMIKLNIYNRTTEFRTYLPYLAHHLIISDTKHINTNSIHTLLLRLCYYRMFTATFLEMFSNNNFTLHWISGYVVQHIQCVNPMNYINNVDQFFDELYFKKFYNLQSAVMHIGSTIALPKLMNGKRFNKELQNYVNGVGGIEVHIATLIQKYLNATIRFFELNHATEDHCTYTHFSLLLPLTKNDRDPSDLAMYMYLIDDVFASVTYDYLYPHDVKQYILIVPKTYKINSKISELIFKSPLIRIWVTAIAIFSIFRCIQRKLLNPKECGNRLVYILFNTFGLTFGCTSVTGVQSRSEVIATFFLSVFGMLAGLLFSGFLFDQLTTTEHVQLIHNLSDVSKYRRMNIGYMHGVSFQLLTHNITL